MLIKDFYNWLKADTPSSVAMKQKWRNDDMVDITVNVNTEKMQKQIKELDLTEINDLETYIRERIQVQRIEDVLFVSLKEGD